MKKIKTFLALILSLCLIMGMTTPAFAKTDEETTEMQTLVETLGKYVEVKRSSTICPMFTWVGAPPAAPGKTR